MLVSAKQDSLAGVAGLLFAALVAGIGSAAGQYDVLIRGGRLLDGAGNPWRYEDIAISGDTIAAVGRLDGATAHRVIDASGLYVAPGFIDTHSHAGPGLAGPELSHGQPLLAQGVTTVFVNPDGGGPVNLAEQRVRLERDGLGVNVALMVPHGSVRLEVVGMADRDATASELTEMRRLVRQAMEQGAFGLSSGLYYAPGSYAPIGEVIDLARIAAEYGGVYTSHIRDEADYSIGVIAAVEEVIRVAREAELRGVVTHVKALGPRVWGFASAIVMRIEAARETGVEVFADQYPYNASGTSITGALIPRWAQVGGRQLFLARLRDPEAWPRLRDDVLENLDRRGGADRLQVQSHPADPSVEGKTLAAIAQARGVEVPDLVRDMLETGGAGLTSFNMDESDIAVLMRQPWTMTASDGGLAAFGQGVPHPRYYGTFPRKIRIYVLEERIIDLPFAIRSMTGLPAAVYRLEDRGTIRRGAKADIAVFDLDELGDRATFEDPHHLSEGMRYVFVNGRAAIDNGQFAAARFGEVLRR